MGTYTLTFRPSALPSHLLSLVEFFPSSNIHSFLACTNYTPPVRGYHVWSTRPPLHRGPGCRPRGTLSLDHGGQSYIWLRPWVKRVSLKSPHTTHLHDSSSSLYSKLQKLTQSSWASRQPTCPSMRKPLPGSQTQSRVSTLATPRCSLHRPPTSRFTPWSCPSATTPSTRTPCAPPRCTFCTRSRRTFTTRTCACSSRGSFARRRTTRASRPWSRISTLTAR